MHEIDFSRGFVQNRLIEVVDGFETSPMRVIGETDKIGGYPISDAQTPENFAATIYEALSLPRETIWKDFTQRPHTLYMGSPISGLT